jgi:hypothetical protein
VSSDFENTIKSPKMRRKNTMNGPNITQSPKKKGRK